MDASHFRLLNEWQQDFPRVERPFAAIGAELGLEQNEVLELFRLWCADGVVSRIGPVVATRRVGVSALAALAAPVECLEAIAARVSALPEVNHNYEREHRFNLWFVLTAVDRARLDAVVEAIAAESGCELIVLPMEEAHHIDLGFDLSGRAAHVPSIPVPSRARAGEAMSATEQTVLRALQRGLPLVPRPYAALAQGVGLDPARVCGIIDGWLASGVLRRFGVVVRHHELGYTANAMCVWDIEDDRAAELGRRLGAEPGVTLCYRRRRALPHWRYNLFAMIHGKARDEVLATRARIAGRLSLDDWPHEVLFSQRRFKQRGACYLPEVVDA